MTDLLARLRMEKYLHHPLLFLFIHAAFFFNIGHAFNSLFRAMPDARLWLLFSIPFAAIGFYSSLLLEKKRKKTVPDIILLIVCSAIWLTLSLVVFPASRLEQTFLPMKTLPALGAALIALLAFKSAAGVSRLLSVPLIIPQKRFLMEKGFHDWIHNYLQDVSIRKISAALRRRLLFFVIITVLATAVSLTAMPYRELTGNILLTIIAFLAMLRFFASLYKYQLYSSWATRGIYVRPVFFSQWSRVVLLIILGAALLASPVLVIDTEIVPLRSVWDSTASLFRSLHRQSRDNIDAINQAYREKELEKATEEISEEEAEELARLQKREPFVKKALRFTVVLFGALLLLALIGGIIKRIFRHKKIPALLVIPAVLWDLLLKFLSITLYLFRFMLHLLPYRKQAQSEPNNAAREALSRLLMSADLQLSKEKKREMRTIIDIYLKFIEEAYDRGLEYHRGFTPREYSRYISRTYKSLESAIEPLTDILYRARYSAEILGPGEIQNARDHYRAGLQELEKLEIVR